MDIFKSRLPDWQEVFIVLSAIVFAVFSWSIRGFLFVLPSIMMRYAAAEITAIFFYMMAFALVESFLIIGCLLIVSAALPKSWFQEGFSYKGFLVVLAGSIASIRYQAIIGNGLPEAKTFFLWAGALTVVLVVLSLVFHFVRRLQVVLVLLAERFTVFAFLYIPLGLIGVAVVIFRNLFKG